VAGCQAESATRGSQCRPGENGFIGAPLSFACPAREECRRTVIGAAEWPFAEARQEPVDGILLRLGPMSSPRIQLLTTLAALAASLVCSLSRLVPGDTKTQHCSSAALSSSLGPAVGHASGGVIDAEVLP
jgi:hypothetical protein